MEESLLGGFEIDKNRGWRPWLKSAPADNVSKVPISMILMVGKNMIYISD
jgi:hypothetical protein